MAKQKIVIVGGGFAGLKAALLLADSKLFDLTLVSDHDDFRYYPTLYHTASGGKKILSSIPLSQIFAHHDIELIQDRVNSLGRDKQQVSTVSGRTFNYDRLILSIGVVTNFFGIKGLDEFAFGIKTNAEALRLKKHLHEQIIRDRHVDHNYVIIGGGPTGVELSGAMSSYIRKIAHDHGLQRSAVHIDLVEAAPRLLPRMPKDISRKVARRLRKLGVKLYLNTAVQAETADDLVVNGKRISSHTVIWTAGVTNHPFFKDNNFQEIKNGKVRVSQYLEAEPNIYVLGDNADTPYSGMAQTALHDGAFVAKNLIRQANGKEPRPYSAKKPITVVPVGNYWSAVLWGQVRIYGFLGWILRRLGDLVGYHDYEPWPRASRLWLRESEEEENCEICRR